MRSGAGDERGEMEGRGVDGNGGGTRGESGWKEQRADGAERAVAGAADQGGAAERKDGGTGGEDAGGARDGDVAGRPD